MAQVIKKDNFKNYLTYSAPNISLAANAVVTIGGQQYTLTSAASIALSGLTANTRYQVYAVVTSGAVSLVYSINENSVGPVGYSSWKLVGSFLSNGSSTFLTFNNTQSPAIAFQAPVSKSEATNYQAEVDGYFVGRILGNTSVSAIARWDVFSDSTATPTTVVTSCFSTGHSAAQFWNGGASGFIIPVKKGNYYRVTRTDVAGTQGYAAIYTWVPSTSTSVVAIEDL